MQNRISPRAVIIILAVLGVYLFFVRSRDYSDISLAADSLITEHLYGYGVTESGLFREIRDARRYRQNRYLYITKELYVPASFPLRRYPLFLEERLKKTRFRISKSDFFVEKSSSSLKLDIDYKHLLIYSLILRRGVPREGMAAAGEEKRLAIVIDDWGYNTRNLNALFSINRPMTISVLPNLRYSAKIAKRAASRNIETILHLPLESQNSAKARPEENTIDTDMEEAEVKRLLDKAIRSVPYIKGASNHMGSKATEDKKLMRMIFDELKTRGLYFLDSLVTSRSVCAQVAREAGIRFAERSTFLDNENERGYIRRQLDEAAKEAEMNGQAIAIGHDRPLTLSVIKENIARIESRGVRLVFLSELVR